MNSGADVMPHYFSENDHTIKSNPKEIAFRVNGTPLKFKTDHGIFAKDGFDRGTKVMLDFYKPDRSQIRTALDLGCGYGVVGIYLNKVFDMIVDMVDINERAVKLCSENVVINHTKATVFKSDGYQNIDKKYDLIMTNPPIRVGKEKMYELLSGAVEYLNDNGLLVLVINKKHGALSAIKYLEKIYKTVETLGRDKGFYVLACRK